MTKDATQKLFEYISLLETVNEQIVYTLKRCIELLTEFTPSVPDQKGWQEMLDMFQEVITVAGKTLEKKTIH